MVSISEVVNNINSSDILTILITGRNISLEKIKILLKNFNFEKIIIEKITNLINNTPKTHMNNKSFKEYLEKNLQNILTLNNKNSSTINQSHSGEGDNVGRDKIIQK